MKNNRNLRKPRKLVGGKEREENVMGKGARVLWSLPPAPAATEGSGGQGLAMQRGEYMERLENNQQPQSWVIVPEAPCAPGLGT